VRRIPLPKPHQLLLGVGVLASLGALASGVVPRLTGWEDHSPISRQVFGNVPDPLYWAFYATVGVMLLVVAWLVSLRVQNYERGKPDNRRTTRTNVKRRLEGFRSGVWMQTLLRDPAAGVMHSMIYFGFLVLFVATVVLEIDHQLPDSAKFLHGHVYEGYAATADVFGVVFVVGILWALGRRYIQRPYRIRIKTKPEDALILGTFLVIGLTGFATEGLRIALIGRPAFEKW
jgi:nitrate reductase gamma subunit